MTGDVLFMLNTHRETAQQLCMCRPSDMHVTPQKTFLNTNEKTKAINIQDRNNFTQTAKNSMKKNQ